MQESDVVQGQELVGGDIIRDQILENSHLGRVHRTGHFENKKPREVVAAGLIQRRLVVGSGNKWGKQPQNHARNLQRLRKGFALHIILEATTEDVRLELLDGLPFLHHARRECFLQFFPHALQSLEDGCPLNYTIRKLVRPAQKCLEVKVTASHLEAELLDEANILHLGCDQDVKAGCLQEASQRDHGLDVAATTSDRDHKPLPLRIR
mmetsp:Transcript_82813/g.234651  ORF Transcript_82813/g.234651 Transcript_82813/m.234651 type:complete len:208 (-) Transcript_82813:133-756(-)